MARRPILRRALLGAAASGLAGVVRGQPAPSRGGSLACFATPEPDSLLPGADPSPAAAAIAGKLFDGLIRLSGGGQAQPGLARAWQIGVDGRSCRFLLRDAAFHDGQAVSSADAAFSLDRQAARSPGAGPAWIAAVETPDPLTLVVTGTGRIDRLLPMFAGLACPVVPRRSHADEEAAETRPVGTGPFRLAEWERGAFLRLRRFPDYWQPDAPVLDEIAWRVVPDPAARLAALRAGEAQLAQLDDLPPVALEGLRADPALQVVEVPAYRGTVCRLDVNHRVAPLGDPLVRRAIGLAVDRDDLVRRVWSGAARAAAGPLPGSAAEPTERDPRTAAALLTQAGLHPDGRGIRLTLRHLVPTGAEAWSRVAASLRASLRQAGIDLLLEAPGAAEWARRVAAWEYETTLICPPGPGSALLALATGYTAANARHVVGANTGGYASPDFDAKLAGARDAVDDGVHAAALRAAEALLIADAAQVWLFEPGLPAIASRRLRGWNGDPYADFADAALD